MREQLVKIVYDAGHKTWASVTLRECTVEFRNEGRWVWLSGNAGEELGDLTLTIPRESVCFISEGLSSPDSAK